MKRATWKFDDGNKSKYTNKRIVIDGVTFDSKLEFECYNWLKIRFKGCKIEIHPKYDIITHETYICSVAPDFEIISKNGERLFVDAKAKDDATFTDVARIKYKLFHAIYKKKIHLWPKEVDLIQKFLGDDYDSEC